MSGIYTEIKKAKQEAIKTGDTVVFTFSDITLNVSQETNPELLLRDFFNALNLGWDNIGPVCQETYDEETQKLIDDKNKELSEV